jgi:AcrR family transcriptional regulator
VDTSLYLVRRPEGRALVIGEQRDGKASVVAPVEATAEITASDDDRRVPVVRVRLDYVRPRHHRRLDRIGRKPGRLERGASNEIEVPTDPSVPVASGDRRAPECRAASFEWGRGEVRRGVAVVDQVDAESVGDTSHARVMLRPVALEPPAAGPVEDRIIGRRRLDVRRHHLLGERATDLELAPPQDEVLYEREVTGPTRSNRLHIHSVSEYMVNVNGAPPPVRLSRPQAKARTRAALLAAGERVLAAKGFHGATVEDIAETAGFSRGAFYANFSDKADLLVTLLDERSRADLAQLAERLEANQADYGLAALAGWFEQTFTAASPLDAAIAEFTPIAVGDPRHTERIRRRMREVREQVTAIVAAECARADFEIPIPAERFATMIIAFVDGLAGLHRLDPDTAPVELLAETLTYLGEGLAASTSTGIRRRG